jgi:uncharacterized protein (DUF305 family)
VFSNRTIRQRADLSAAVGAVALVLVSACGGTALRHDQPAAATAAPVATPGSPDPSENFNDADVMFARMMISHHEQAIDMAELAETRASDPEVKELAAKIKADQEQEIKTMQSWLQAWNQAAPTGNGMDHEMPGGMDEQDMEKLEAAEGAAFDKQFLQMMIGHHKGAVSMAAAEQDRGKNPEARRLAEKIESSQEAEIEQMQKILNRL